MREMLCETGSAELGYWLAYLRLDDERREKTAEHAFGGLLGG